MRRPLHILLFFITLFAGRIYGQTLVMNEVSNGTTGTQEYVEFIVVDTAVVYSCSAIATPPCVDIRGWIYDDNSGYHSGGAPMSGVAAGAVRFSFDAMWQCVPVGTIIVIYDNTDRNPSIPPDDLSMSDGNCRIIAPINNTTLFERNTTTPGAAACSYPSSGWVAGGLWSTTGLLNSTDCARLVNLAGCEVFSVCYGNLNNQNNIIYFTGAGGGRVYYFSGTDPFSQVNWTSAAASASQTPGVANNATNQAFINQFNNGCSPITPLSVTSSSANAGCTCTGTASVTASGSIGPYTYLWSNGATTSSVNGLCAGTYTVDVTSAINCTETLTFTITSVGAPNANAGTTQTISCASPTTVLNGSSTTVGSTFSWAGAGIVSGGSTATPTVNAAGTYTLTVTSGGCSTTSTVSVTSNTTLPNISIAVPSQLTCTTNTVALAGSSTTPGVTFQWTSGPATATHTVSATGVYTLTVTNPANGCVNTATTTVTSNTIVPNVSIAAPASLSCTTTTVSLSGLSTTPGATFQWTSGPATANNTVSAVGTYTLTTTNPANGCINTATVAVTNSSTLPDVSILAPAQLTCAATSLNLSGSSTTAGVTYSWGGPGIVSGGSTTNPVINAAGTYTLTVTDGGGCTNTATTTITSNTVIPNVSIGASTPLTCITTNVTLTGASTTGGATFQWTSGPATPNYTVSTAGNYTLTVTDPTNGCINTATTTVMSSTTTPNVSIAAPGSLTCVVTNVTLMGASTTAGATFQWTSGPATASNAVSTVGVYTLTVTDPVNSCINTATTTVTSNTTIPNVSIANPGSLTCVVTNVTLTGASTTAGATFQWTSGPATASNTVSTVGIYTLTVTDPVNGCTSATNTAVTSNTVIPDVSIAPPASLTCAIPSITLNGSSTTAGVTFQWTGGPAIANNTVSASGTYTLTATDALNGCTNTATVSVINTGTFPDISIATPGQLTCVTSSVVLNGSSTVPGATFQWTGGPSTANYTVTSIGTYTLTVTDPGNGCSTTATATVGLNIATPDVSITTPAPLTCTTLSTSLNGSSTVTGLAYQWTSGPATANFTVNSVGIYTLTVTDPTNGCTNTATATVGSNITVPDINIAAPANLTCITTSVILSATSSIPGAGFQWTGGGGANYTVTAAGSYSATVTDPANGCVNTASVTVVSNTTLPGATFTSANLTGCAALCVSLMPDLPQNPLWNYIWTFTDGTVVNQYNGTNCFAIAGTYGASLTVTNENNCSSTHSVNNFIQVHPNPIALFDYNPINPSTYDPLVIFSNQSTGATDYLWTFDTLSNSIIENPAYSFPEEEGIHIVSLVAQNSFGCKDSVATTITVEGEFAVYVPNTFTPNNDLYNNSWGPVGVGVDETNYEMSVYDRWGTKIYSTTDWQNGAWDGRYKGTLVQVDTYIYKIKVSPKSTTALEPPRELNGHVNVVR